MELYAHNMHFLGDTENDRAYDACVHGKIIFSIGGKSLSGDGDRCVSASSYRFLHTLFSDHVSGDEEFLIPCCGHMMIPSDDKTAVIIIGCNNGIDFDVTHLPNEVSIKTADVESFSLPFAEYRDAVLSFADQVEEFYKNSPPRRFYDDHDRDGYEAFRAEWDSLRERAKKL